MIDLTEKLMENYRIPTGKEIERDYSNWKIDPELKRILSDLSSKGHRLLSKENEVPYFFTKRGIMILDNATVLDKLPSLLEKAFILLAAYTQKKLPSEGAQQMLEGRCKSDFAQAANSYIFLLEEISKNLEQETAIIVDGDPKIIQRIYENLLEQANSLTLVDMDAYLTKFNLLRKEAQESRTHKYESNDENAEGLIKLLIKLVPNGVC